jgi:hypothetical protein
MPITLSLTGRADLSDHRLTRSEARDWLAKCAVWFEGVGDTVLDARLARDAEDKPVLLVVLHPAAPPAEVRLGASGRVRVSAVTTPAGPGYHAYLCDLLRQFAEDFDLAWEPPDHAADPTGYFNHRDRAATEERFLDWLGSACAVAAVRPAPTSVGLPAGHGFHFPADVLTPLGPRSPQWLAAIAEDPTRGRDFFAWWAPCPNAAFYRNRALARLWCDFPWRRPLTEAEGELADQIANDLATAFKLDPAAELPWAEWLELLGTIEADTEGFTVTPSDRVLSVELWKRAGPPPAPSSPRIGYRRYPVRVGLTGGWSVRVPGDFAREWEDDRTWTAWSLTRTVWFHALGFTKPDGSRPSAAEAVDVGRRSLPEGEPVAGIDRDGVRGEAVFGPTDEDGRTVWRLSGVAAVEGQLVVCNVYAEDPADRDWVVETWQSLRHNGNG